jgi:N-acetylglucosamine-6-phosphate deacetylase
MRFQARRFDNATPVEIETEHGRVLRVRPIAEPAQRTSLPWVAPGFVDVQVNGYNGQEFAAPDLTPEKVATIIRKHFEFGVTGICPTLTTQSFDVMQHGMRQIAAACEQWPEVAAAMVGIHQEGPYFAEEDGPRGAHPLEHVRPPNWDEFQRLQEAAGGRIKILTMSVHFDNAAEFIAQVTASGVVVAVGHTGATGSQIRAAVDAGAQLSTHLGNGAHRMLRRHPNYIWDQLAEDRLVASLIVDGHHLPPEVVKSMVRAKTPSRVILVSDVSGWAGMPPGRYASMGGEIDILADGRLCIAGQDQLLAGASAPIGVGVANVMRFAGVDLATAVDMAATGPARLIGAPCGGLRPGDRADFVLFQLVAGKLDVVATMAGGEWRYQGTLS